MSVAVVINGVTYQQPNQGTPPPWGDTMADIIVAMVASMLQKTGGTFTLSADVDFGASFGLKSLYYKSRSSNLSTTGVVRFANNEGIGWRNAANGADLLLKADASDHLVFGTKDLTPMTTNGDMIYQASGVPTRLAIGSSNQILVVSGGVPTWSSAPGSGDVVGPASSTNGYVALWDGTTGKLLKNSTLDPSTIVIGPASAVNNRVVFFDSTSGKLIKDSGLTLAGSNTGDVTLANTTNGLTIVNQVLTMALAATGASGSVSATTQTFTGIKTFETQLIGKGTATNNSASAGFIGEYVSSVIASGSAISSGSTGQFKDITSISLTAGDWDVSGVAVVGIGTGTGMGACGGAISINSNNTTTDQVRGDNEVFSTIASATNDSFNIIPAYRMSLSGTTTVYLKGRAGFSGGQPTIYGRISARRVR